MRRTPIVLAVVLLAVMLVAVPGLAVAKGGASFTIYGKITALNGDARTIDVAVESPDSFHGATVTVQTTATTRFKQCLDGSSYRISFDDLVVGSYVKVAGTVVGGAYVANSVIQY